MTTPVPSGIRNEENQQPMATTTTPTADNGVDVAALLAARDAPSCGCGSR